MAYFPMFIDIEHKPCLIVGGGKVAYRKARVLLDFGAKVYLEAPEIMDVICSDAGIISKCKCFAPEDVTGMALVVAATDDARLNHQISQICQRKNIPVNAVDQIEDCSFIFPAYLRQQDVVAAYSSSGKSPVVTQYLKRQNVDLVTPRLGEITALLGSVREKVQQQVPTEAERKRIYEDMLESLLESEELPAEEELIKLFKRRD
ncbi:MAG: bifunctional precorrin-2 dehydrogenase/sirohydrochlorin ferrochelatase [Roseburia sp.]